MKQFGTGERFMSKWNIHNIILVVVFGSNPNVVREMYKKLNHMIEYYVIKVMSSNSFIKWKIKILSG